MASGVCRALDTTVHVKTTAVIDEPGRTDQPSVEIRLNVLKSPFVCWPVPTPSGQLENNPMVDVSKLRFASKVIVDGNARAV